MKSTKFPQILAAVRTVEDAAHRADDGLWRIGDALIAECGPPSAHGVNDKSHEQLRRVADELQRLDFRNYSLIYLRKLRANAVAFPDDKRLSSVSWSVHLEAGDPKAFEAVRKQAQREKQELTVGFVKKFKRRRDAEARSRPDAPPPGSDHADDVIAKSKALTAAGKARNLASDFQESIEPILERLRPEEIEQLADAASAVATDWSKLANTLRDRGNSDLREAAE